ncbi:MAG: hypothetical protein HWN66_06340 [Candidatus Helarchaeota archaeon]|nr:hypothetical protein [Candidatus Helarchaeota archaeon]
MSNGGPPPQVLVDVGKKSTGNLVVDCICFALAGAIVITIYLGGSIKAPYRPLYVAISLAIWINIGILTFFFMKAERKKSKGRPRIRTGTSRSSLPNSIQYYLEKAATFEKYWRYDEAIQVLKEGEKSWGGLGFLELALIALYVKKKDFNQALQYLECHMTPDFVLPTLIEKSADCAPLCALPEYQALVKKYAEKYFLGSG